MRDRVECFEFFVCVVLCGAAIGCRLIMMTIFCRLRLLVTRDMKAADIVVDLLLVELGVVVRGSSCVGVQGKSPGVPASPQQDSLLRVFA